LLDVGANKGQYAGKLRDAGFDGWIVSFEPVAGDFEVLARQAAHDPRWTVHQMALGRETGEIAMNIVPGTLSSLLPPTKFGAERYRQLQDVTSQKVQVRRLDEVWSEVTGHVPECRAYLKLDTQGFDLEAFAGLGARVEELVGMQSEVALLKIYEGMPTMTEALAVYEGSGFEVSGMFPVSRERRTGRVLEFDCVLVRQQALPED
jgi:FkbM family methyltransferase